eukprot:5002388-Prymnesium_polylepis.1
MYSAEGTSAAQAKRLRKHSAVMFSPFLNETMKDTSGASPAGTPRCPPTGRRRPASVRKPCTH